MYAYRFFNIVANHIWGYIRYKMAALHSFIDLVVRFHSFFPFFSQRFLRWATHIFRHFFQLFFVARYRASSKRHRFCTNVHFSDNTTGTGCQWKYVLQRGENNKTSFCNVQIFLQVLLLEAAVAYFVVFCLLAITIFADKIYPL